MAAHWLVLALTLTTAPASPGWRADRPEVAEIDLPRFHLFSTPAAAATAQLLARRLEADRDALAKTFGEDYPGITEVRVGEGADEMARLDVPDSTIPRWAAGISHPGGNLVLFDAVALRRDGGLSLIRHELAHAALGQLGGPELPRWFQEGVAVMAASEWSAESDLALVRAAHSHLPLSSLEHGFPEGLTDIQLAYAESASYVQFLYDRHGAAAMQRLIRESGQGVPFETAFSHALGDRAQSETDWLDSIRLRYTWIPVVTGSGTLFGLIAVLCVLAYARRRRGQQLRMAELALEDQALESARRIRLAEERQLPPAATEPPPAAVEAAVKPTLH